jgi:hypothetical protein
VSQPAWTGEARKKRAAPRNGRVRWRRGMF